MLPQFYEIKAKQRQCVATHQSNPGYATFYKDVDISGFYERCNKNNFYNYELSLYIELSREQISAVKNGQPILVLRHHCS